MKKTFLCSLMLATAIAGNANAQSIFEALSQAYETNPTLQAQRAYLRAVDENVAIAKSGYRPNISLNGSYTDNNTDVKNSVGSHDGDQYSYSARISQPLFNGLQTLNSVKSADSMVLSEQNNLHNVEQTVFIDASTAYLDVVQNKAIVDLQKNNEIRLQEAYEKAKIEFRKDNPLSSGYLRRMMVEAFHIEQKCSCCGLKEWNNQPIPLEVHHKDGDSTNNEISNLEFLCLNCHALTDTFRGKNMENQGFKKVLDEDLIEALKNSTSIRQALVAVGLAPKGGNYNRAYELMSKNNISLKK